GDFDTDSVVVNSKLTVTNTVYASAFSSTSPLKLQTNGTTRIYVDDASGNVGVGTDNPQSSAALEVNSTTKGFLPPRVTTVEMNAIPSPVTGLCVYNTDVNVVCYYNGSSWDCMDAQSLFNKTFLCGKELIDYRDERSYATVKIGNQCWMAENLAYLPQVDNVAAGSEDSPGSYYYVYGYTPNGANEAEEVANAKLNANYTTYGVLYNWQAAMAGSGSSTSVQSGVQGICPNGWHLPSDEEWKMLEGEVDSKYGYPDPEWDGSAYRGKDAGGNLKETGTSHWNSQNTGATNSSGFTALPGGYRYDPGHFSSIGYYALYWSSTEHGTHYAWYRRLTYSSSDVYRNDRSKNCGFSVRCTKD
ncbi:MAG: hypothetical protein GY746_16130, partial [Gammaproteobacteria bacterium]|nr:hypothetical protein [Gammaproteobacteria bacterium]